jgi:prephenate dehydratase
LQTVARYNVNMTKIESRPVKDRPGEYRFFIEAECEAASEDTKNMIAAIREQALEYKLLGAYAKNK